MISPKRNIPVCFHQELLHNYDAYFGTWSENIHNAYISDPISVLKELWEFACPVWSLHKNPNLANEPLTYIPRQFGPGARKSVFGVCKQQRRRPACACTQSDQRLYCSLIGKYHKPCYEKACLRGLRQSEIYSSTIGTASANSAKFSNPNDSSTDPMC